MIIAPEKIAPIDSIKTGKEILKSWFEIWWVVNPMLGVQIAKIVKRVE